MPETANENSHGPHWFYPENDPTKNVLDVIKAEGKYQDGMRDMHGKIDVVTTSSMTAFQNFARESESRMQSWMRDAESHRVDQLAAQRKDYEAQIAGMLAAAVTEKSSLVANQLLQIQSSFGERVNRLEEFRLLSTGRQSVSDPQIAASFDMINKNIEATQAKFSTALNEFATKTTIAMDVMAKSILALQESGTKGSGREVGRHEMIAWIVAAVGFMVSIATGVALFSHLAPVAGHLASTLI
jgi:hypothetical protein